MKIRYIKPAHPDYKRIQKLLDLLDNEGMTISGTNLTITIGNVPYQLWDNHTTDRNGNQAISEFPPAVEFLAVDVKGDDDE